MTLSPALCALVLRPSKTPRGFFHLFNIGLNWTRNTYLFVGGLLVRRTLLTIILFGLILFGNYYFYQRLPSAFLPTEDKGTIFCEVVLPAGASLPRTEAALAEVSDLVRDVPGVNQIMTVPGRSLTAGEGENLGLLIVDLKPWAERTTPETQISQIQSAIIKRAAVLPDASVNAFVPPAIMGLGATGGVTFSLQATGDQSSQEIAQTTNHLLSKIMETGKAVYAFTSFDANTPMLYLDINRDKAEAMNVGGPPLDSRPPAGGTVQHVPLRIGQHPDRAVVQLRRNDESAGGSRPQESLQGLPDQLDRYELSGEPERRQDRQSADDFTAGGLPLSGGAV